MNQGADMSGVYGVRAILGRAETLFCGDPNSSAAGSFDRAFWNYRTITDFRAGAWQQLIVGYATIGNSNFFDDDTRMLCRSRARAGLMAWRQAQHCDGSVDEWFRNEHSYCATAFGLAAAAETVLLLEKDLSKEEKSAVQLGLVRAARWLERRFNDDVMNQNLAAAVGLWLTWRVTGDMIWRDAACKRAEHLGRLQSKEGWFTEYGGMDLGYSTLALDLLAVGDSWGMSGLEPMAGRLCAFLDAVIGPSGWIPGKVGSRATEHAFTFGAIYFAPRFAQARNLAQKLRRGHAAGLSVGLSDVDDRYFAYFYFPAFARLLAMTPAWMDPDASPVQQAAGTTTAYDACGLVVRTSAGVRLTFNRRNGTIAFETPRGRRFYQLGYEVVVRGRRYSSCTWTTGVLARGEEIAQSNFGLVSDGRPLERLMVPFQAFVRILAVPGLSDLFNRWMKRRMIRPKKSLPGGLLREIWSVSDGFVVRDTIKLPAGALLDRILPAVDCPMHSPSARQGLGARAWDLIIPKEAIPDLREKGCASIEWTILSDAGTP